MSVRKVSSIFILEVAILPIFRRNFNKLFRYRFSVFMKILLLQDSVFRYGIVKRKAFFLKIFPKRALSNSYFSHSSKFSISSPPELIPVANQGKAEHSRLHKTGNR